MVYGAYVEKDARKISDHLYEQVAKFRNVAETYATGARRTSIPQEEPYPGIMEKTGDPCTTISYNLVVVPCAQHANFRIPASIFLANELMRCRGLELMEIDRCD